MLMLYKRYNIIDRIKCDTTTLTVIQHEESCDPHEQKKWSMHMLARLALYMVRFFSIYISIIVHPSSSTATLGNPKSPA